ncbi:sodium-dependent transporter [Marinithermus hydrothermalis]|uniref:Transporter n=1 Tax=Marinithermus hydrothermalis (strain DSM 14884 / JCM 11576 / T1) TaxID=869210 RepID=F2NQW3_MARHT|nr:sodium-dependent transporter [Marinithermus hydrothermalis]AEB12327.1 sodium:neurotransmitter symporter [Marinithermus hydrothermalis DSM 14884]
MQRETWATRTGFVLAAVGSAIGLGNIWRFPYVTYENGGGAFLLPYLIALFTAGIPLLIFEFAIGHKYRGSAPLALRRISEKWEWLGWWPVLVSFVITLYYTVVIAWAVSYAWFALTQAWGADTKGFFFGSYLGLPDTFWPTGGLQPSVAIALILVWIASFLIMVRGVSEGIERANKIFMPLLLVLMLIITLRGITLPGAVEGLNHLFTPDWSKLFDGKVWLAAYGQIFFSLSVGLGVMITYASYLPKKADLTNNAFITALANSGFSLLAALGVFGAIGFMAQAQGVPVNEVAAGGVGLAFIVFPQILNSFPALGGLFGFLFFVALVVAGMSSLISLVNVVAQSVADKFGISYKQAVIGVHVVAFLGSLLFATKAGLIYLDIVDHFINNYGIALIGLAEVVAVFWIWKIFGPLADHADSVSDFRVSRPWLLLSAGILTPILLTVMAWKALAADLAQPYGGYPMGLLIGFGWLTVLLVIVAAFLIQRLPWGRSVAVEMERREA